GETVLSTNTAEQKMTSKNDTLTVGTRNERDHGGSNLSYNYNHYTTGNGLDSITTGTNHSVSAADDERFGHPEQFRRHTGMSYLRRDAPPDASEEVIANADLQVEHRPTLNSYYDFNYDHYEDNIFTSDTYVGQASLSHQLYESLNSGVSLRGSDTETS